MEKSKQDYKRKRVFLNFFVLLCLGFLLFGSFVAVNAVTIFSTTQDRYSLSNASEDLRVYPSSGVLNNDFGASIAYVNNLTTQKGTLYEFNQDGSFWYFVNDENSDFHGVDYFDYIASDGTANSTSTRVWIGVNNSNPVAFDDKYNLNNASEDLRVYSSSGVLNNDFDFDKDKLTVYLVNAPFNGQLYEFNQDGSFWYYTNSIDFHGVDYFDYVLSDGYSNSSVARAVIGVNDTAPVAVEDKYIITNSINTTNETGILVNDSDVDGDVKYASVVEDVKFGELIQIEGFAVNGSFNYTSNKTNGVDYFTYLVSDLYLNSNTVNTIFVIGNNTAPNATADVYNYTLENATFEANATQGVLANDTDAEGDILFAKLVNDSTLNGTLDFGTDGSFVYTPTKGFSGIESFSYVATDLDLSSAETTVQIYVNYTAPAPIITINSGGGGGRGRTTVVNETSPVVTTGNETLPQNNTVEETPVADAAPQGFFGNLLTGNVIGAFGTTGGKIGTGIVAFLVLLGLAYWFVAARRKRKAKKVVKKK